MVLRIEPLVRALTSVDPQHDSHRILTSARGRVWNQKRARELVAQAQDITIIAGHYEGVDERIGTYIDDEISLGDFVMTGGELTAAAMVDSMVRILHGVLKKEEATAVESFMEVSVAELSSLLPTEKQLLKLQERGVTTVRLLEYPQYTRPQSFEGSDVPALLRSGNPKEIRAWQLCQAYAATLLKRPDLLL